MTCPYNCNQGKIFNRVLKRYQPCPNCAGLLSNRVVPETDTDIVSELNRLGIPEDTPVFDPDAFFETRTDKIYAKATYSDVLNQLVAIETAIKTGSVLKESCYFYLGIYNNREEYVNRCLIEAVRHGLTAVPFMSLLTISALRAKDKNIQRLHPDVSYIDFLVSDVCFISVSANTTDNEIYLLSEILEERARNHLPTYVMGYWSVRSLIGRRHALRFLIAEDSKRLGLLNSYEIMTKTTYEEEMSAADKECNAIMGLTNAKLEVTKAIPSALLGTVKG